MQPLNSHGLISAFFELRELSRRLAHAPVAVLRRFDAAAEEAHLAAGLVAAGLVPEAAGLVAEEADVKRPAHVRALGAVLVHQ